MFNKPRPRLSDEMRKEAKRFKREEDLIRELIPAAEPGQPIFYDRRRGKVTIRIELDGAKQCRVVFQSINNREGSHLERLIDLINKENPSGIMLPLSPFDVHCTKVYRVSTEIDEALISRYSGRKAFRVSAESRVVHEKVSGMKRISVNHSMLYNFSSEGAFHEL